MKQFFKYLLVGILNSGIGYAIIFICMYGLGLSAVLTNVIGYGFGMLMSYGLNKNFTFRGADGGVSTFGRFVIVFLVAYLANLLMLLYLIRELRFHEGLSQILAGGIYVGVSFLISKWYVFRISD